jgi:hypothetical protein
MDFVDFCIFLCIVLGIPLALFALRWFLSGPPDPTNRDDQGPQTPW